MQTLADGLLEFESKGDYIAVVSFFFVESHPDQGHPRCLVATLAHQMAEQCASIRPFIADAVADRGSIFSMALKYQVENLLIKPVECAAQTHGISLPCAILVVDGLHECGPIKPSHGVGGQTAQATRSLVIQLLHSLAASGLFRVAISSQPGQHVSDALNQEWDDVHHLDLGTQGEFDSTHPLHESQHESRKQGSGEEGGHLNDSEPVTDQNQPVHAESTDERDQLLEELQEGPSARLEPLALLRVSLSVL
jgi:hypothetical protein